MRTDMSITTGHRLLTNVWTADVEAAEAAIGRFASDGSSRDTCHVAFFEIPDDDQLHVNVTHRYATKTASGWMGAGRVPDGFVHNRRFSDAQARQMTRHVRDMIFSTRT